MRACAVAIVSCMVACGEVTGPEEIAAEPLPDLSLPTASRTVRDPPRAVPAGPPAPGAACAPSGTYACIEGDVLFCRAGYGGATWQPRAACGPGTSCAQERGCMPLPTCATPGLLACAGNESFRCETDGAWTLHELCPEEVPCVHGRGCPNELGIGTRCDPGTAPRCHDGLILRCRPAGLSHRWSAPEACAEGSACVAGQGCVRPGGCNRRNHAHCIDVDVAVVCLEDDDGVLDWSAPVHCWTRCNEGSGCVMPCRRLGPLGTCAD